MSNIDIQIQCMKKLKVPQNKINKILEKNGREKNLSKKLIECEEQYANYNEIIHNQETKFDITCNYFDEDIMKCKLNKNNCMDCKDYINLDRLFTEL